MNPSPCGLKSMGNQKSMWLYSDNPTAGMILKDNLPAIIDNSLT